MNPFENVDKTLAFMVKFKTKMQNLDLVRAKTKCPACGGIVHGTLNGRKQHLHFACETKDCYIRGME